MPEKYVPGTQMPYSGISGEMFAVFRPMIRAADGLTLGQVSAITGLEYSTIQNWVKRGFVAHPIRKKYFERHLARILIISIMRDCMKIDDIGELLRLVNGDASDESDDIIPEDRLYDDLCEIIRRVDIGTPREETQRIIREVTACDAPADRAGQFRLTTALLTMVCAYSAGQLKKEADLLFSQLKEGL